ncbi:MAG: hypothetical protein FJY76_03685 [Candidatus Aenigmarchaeota archaeon]|nr:hypothetical protein [Candidatus Aenigmarchaeota archaeon]
MSPNRSGFGRVPRSLGEAKYEIYVVEGGTERIRKVFRTDIREFIPILRAEAAKHLAALEKENGRSYYISAPEE